MSRVVVVGSLNVDVVTRVERHPRPGETVLGEGMTTMAGGKGANQAAAARAAGAVVTMVGAVGQDDAGRRYAARLAAHGIDARLSVVAGQPTGHAFVVVAESGENAIVVVPGANAHLSPRAVTDVVSQVGPGDVVLCQLEVPIPAVAAAARTSTARGARFVLNAAPWVALPADVVELADPLVVNEVEASLLADSAVVPRSVCVTFGAAGAHWDGRRAAGIPVADVVDTTGAGDAFCGAFAAALERGADRDTALSEAVRAGAAAVGRPGAQPDPYL